MMLYSDSSICRDFWLLQNRVLTMLSSSVSVGLLVAHRVIHACLAVHEINSEAVYPIRYFFNYKRNLSHITLKVIC